ncbi:metallophosphatase [Pareuzebyella sediminis]|uniref:metallophosphatase n=1 Tax=Pareuzebyella sediminis TaxID=2607998 RepID=UPI0011EDE23F|nr:metallophosphatase [Pareuzebyella sediminis]
MKRRAFLKNTSVSGAYIGLGGIFIESCAAEQRQVTILHTNDVHSHIDPFPSNHSEYPNLGGVARRASLIETIRKENPNTLLFDAGDIFQGTPYFNFYGGELEFKLMSMLKYDAVTIGNHDFDNGIEGLFAQIPNAEFAMLSANYDFSNTLMDGQVAPYKTYTLDGIKIGVYGLGIKLDGLVTKKLFKETKYLDPYEMAQDTERILKENEACDLIICLSHIGYDYQTEDRPSDLKLAALLNFTHLIIGGHTHTFLDKPTIVQNRKGLKTLVNQVGCYGVNLGRIDFYFDNRNTSPQAKGISISV